MKKSQIAYLLQSFYIGGIETCLYNIKNEGYFGDGKDYVRTGDIFTRGDIMGAYMIDSIPSY